VSYWKCRVERLIFKRVYARFRYFYCVLLNVRCRALKFQRANTWRSHILHVFVVPDVTIGTFKYDFRLGKTEPLLFTYFFLVTRSAELAFRLLWPIIRVDRIHVVISPLFSMCRMHYFCIRVVALFACWRTSRSDITLVFVFFILVGFERLQKRRTINFLNCILCLLFNSCIIKRHFF
jgi:hypothetical protein